MSIRYILVFLVLLGSVNYLVGMEEPEAKRQRIEANTEDLDRALFCAVDNGNEMLVEDLLKKGADSDSVIAAPLTTGKLIEFYNRTLGGSLSNKVFMPLHLAAYRGYLPIVKLLIENGASINALFDDFTPLFLAAQEGHKEIVRFLIEHGARLGTVTEYTPLHVASNRGWLEIVQLLVERGAHVNAGLYSNDAIYKYKITPLFLAVEEGHREIVKFLVEHGAYLGAHDEFTPLHAAVKRGDREIVQFLVERGADVNAGSSCETGTPLHTLFKDGIKIPHTMEIIKLLLDHKADINSIDANGDTPLLLLLDDWYASCNTYDEDPSIEELVTFLLQQGADVNVMGGEDTIFSDLMNFNELELAQLCLKYGADVNGFDRSKRVPLNDAIECHRVDHNILEKIKFLLEHGARVRVTLTDGSTLLTTLWEEDQSESTKILLQHGLKYDPSIESERQFVESIFQNQPLISAALSGDLDKVRSCTIQKRDASSEEALMYAAAQGHKDIFLYLLGQGIGDPVKVLVLVKRIIDREILSDEERNRYESIKDQCICRLPLLEQILERRALWLKLIEGRGRVPEELSERIAKLNLPDLLSAVRNGRADLVLWALQTKADPNMVDQKGVPVLTLAALYPYTDQAEKMVQLLLAYGAQPSQKLLYALTLSDDIDERNTVIALIFKALQRS